MKSIDILDALEQDVSYIESCVDEYNNSQVPYVPTEYLSACIKENGEIVGEIIAEIHFGNVLFIDILWVHEKYRGKGYGTALMIYIENLSIEKGCKLSHVSTYEFQALGLYEKLGYTVFGFMDDVPLGYKDYYLQKKLTSSNTIDSSIKIHEPTDKELEHFCIGLQEYNNSKLLFDNIPKSSSFSKCIKVSGEIVGGISAYTFWNMAVIEALWVKEEFRNNGYATALLNALESHAKEHRSSTIYFETFNPQMRNLCGKLAYTVYGVMANYPEGYDRYYMCKKLTDDAILCPSRKDITNMKDIIRNHINTWLEEETEDFSGVLSATGIDGVIYQQAIGFRNRAEELPNTTDTAFGIASGTKLFTGLAVCKLIDAGKLSLEDKLWDLLSYDLGQIDKRITVYQLLTHISGVGDYIDEEAEDCDGQLKALYEKYPAHLWERLDYYLQMITPLSPKFEPGKRFCYSNSGYVLLGLVIEAVSGLSYQQFVHDEIIKPCELTHTGFYCMDALPPNTALGYIQDEDTKKWRTNTDSIPIIGGSDGGMFSCAADMDKLWRSIFAHKILSDEMTKAFLKPHVVTEEDEDEGIVESYGLGVYHYKDGDKTFYFAIGADSGVGFFTGYYPTTRTVVSSFCNAGYNGSSLLFDELPELLG